MDDMPERISKKELWRQLQTVEQRCRHLHRQVELIMMGLGNAFVIETETITFDNGGPFLEHMAGPVSVKGPTVGEKLTQLHRIVQSNTQRLNALDGAKERILPVIKRPDGSEVIPVSVPFTRPKVIWHQPEDLREGDVLTIHEVRTDDQGNIHIEYRKYEE